MNQFATATPGNSQGPSPAVKKGSWGVAALQSSRQARRESQTVLLQSEIDGSSESLLLRPYQAHAAFHRLELNKRVLEVRCQTGGLLVSVKPSYGVGVEISQRLVDVAQKKHPSLNFICASPEDLALAEKFDYVVVGHIFDTVDILAALNRVRAHCTQDTLVLIVNYNHLWEPVLELASSMGLRAPYVEPNWLSSEDVHRFLVLSGFAPLRTHQMLLCPKYIPLIVSGFLNEFLAKLPGAAPALYDSGNRGAPKACRARRGRNLCLRHRSLPERKGQYSACGGADPRDGKTHGDHFLRTTNRPMGQPTKFDGCKSCTRVATFGCWMGRESAKPRRVWDGLPRRQG